MAILYRHIRLDKNEPFYIGVGKTLERAFAVRGRNKYWNNIHSKTPIEIEILFEDLTIEEAFIKEAEFIKLYGRKDLGLGPLVNMADGGIGTLNHSPETIESIKSKLTGRKVSVESAKKSAMSRTGLKRGESTKIKLSLKLKNKPKSEAHKLALSKSKTGKKSNRATAVNQYDKNGNFLRSYESQLEASRVTGINRNSINNNLKNLAKTAGGCVFKYKS